MPSARVQVQSLAPERREKTEKINKCYKNCVFALVAQWLNTEIIILRSRVQMLPFAMGER
jgi:hypothetical protein